MFFQNDKYVISDGGDEIKKSNEEPATGMIELLIREKHVRRWKITMGI